MVTALGFEERSLTSSQRLFAMLKPERAVLVRYPVPGFADEIRAAAQESSVSLHELDYDDVYQNKFELPEGEMVIDVTGLAKPAIFRLVSQSLARDRTVVVAHTKANLYYPLDQDIDPIIVTKRVG